FYARIFWPSFWRESAPPTLNEQGAQLASGQTFFGIGTLLNLGRFAIRDPLVYATANANPYSWNGTPDASLIDGSLPVPPSGSVTADRLPYWPSYTDSSPDQRAKYLDWL